MANGGKREEGWSTPYFSGNQNGAPDPDLFVYQFPPGWQILRQPMQYNLGKMVWPISDPRALNWGPNVRFYQCLTRMKKFANFTGKTRYAKMDPDRCCGFPNPSSYFKGVEKASQKRGYLLHPQNSFSKLSRESVTRHPRP